MGKRLRGKAGFTLIEILIVIIILGILAMIIVPQITVSTDDAKVSTLQADLSALRSAIEVYYAQHGNKYPGQTDTAGGSSGITETTAASYMVAQLTMYTDEDGATAAAKDTTYKFGPYVKGTTLPQNPFNNSTAVVCDDTATINKARSASGTEGWRYHYNTGVVYANDSTTHAAY